jgi:type I restriction enzyme S subunit
LEKGQIILSARGTVGALAMLKRDMAFNQSCYGLNAKPYITFNDYLYYLIRDNIATLTGQAHGAVFDTITRDTFDHITVSLPPLPEQKSIASVLSSLDDKIDLLHRQNKTLEALAETLFRQWFVEEAEEGWKMGQVKDLFVLQRGFDLPAQHRTAGRFPIFSASGVHGYHNEYRVQAPGVTTGRSGLLGHVFYIMDDFWPLNTSLFIVEYKLAKPLFAYSFLKTLDLEGLNGGSAVPTLNRNDVHSLETSLPPLELIDRFESVTQPMFCKIKENRNQIQTLARFRDTLLPKLMSGEVKVKN